ncbi:MAG: hypothetical protein AB1Z23_01970 [Eubacteriales bacterium]
MKKNSIDKILNPIIILIYIVALAVVTYFHEPWFDEVQAYLIARDASIMDIIFRIPHYEAHPALWHLYLVPFAKSNIPFEIGLKSASIIINAIAISLFIYKAPFMRAIRYALPFTYYFFYLYGVVARCYSITMLAFVLMAISYKSRNTKPIFYVLSMALLCLSSIYGVIFAGGLCIVWLLEIIGEKGLLGLTKSLLKDKRTLWMLGLLFVTMLLIYLIFPSKDAIATYYPKSQPLVYRLFYMFILAPTEAVFAHHFTGEYHIFKGEIPIYTAIIGIAVFAIYTLAVYIVSKSKGKLKETIIPYVLFALFAGTMYFSEHHIPVISYFTLFIAWICFEESFIITIPNWLTKSSPDKQTAEVMIKKSLGVFAAICILIPMYWNISVIINDVRYPYDSKREIAEFIKENNLEDANIMAAFRTLEDCTETEHDCLNIQRDATVNAYFGRNIIYSLNDGKAGYIQHFMADQEYIDQTLAKWREIGAPDVLIGSVDLEYIFDGEITMHDYTPVLVAYQQIFVKNDSVRLWSAVTVYVRNDLVEAYGLVKVEK